MGNRAQPLQSPVIEMPEPKKIPLRILNVYWRHPKMEDEQIKLIPVSKKVTLYILTDCPNKPEDSLKFTIKTCIGYDREKRQHIYIDKEVVLKKEEGKRIEAGSTKRILFKYPNFCYHCKPELIRD